MCVMSQSTISIGSVVPSPLPTIGRYGRSIAAIGASRGTLPVFIATWLICLGALATVINSQRQVNRTTHALLSIGDIQRSLAELTLTVFSPALVPEAGRPTPAERQHDLVRDKAVLAASALNLANALGTSGFLPIRADLAAYLPELDHVATLVDDGSLVAGTAAYGRMNQPDGSYAALVATLDGTNVSATERLDRVRMTGLISVVAAFSFMLFAFSLAIRRAARSTRQRQELLAQARVEALTDELTGLPNRRSLFADMDLLLAHPPPHRELALGMFDLDGFKSYNDAFGHPAGDALLARMAHRLAAAVAGNGSAYRMGGDEFCVIGYGANAETVLSAAESALTERGDNFDVMCSRGQVAVAPGEMTLDDALRLADQRLYVEKDSRRVATDKGAHGVLVQVMSESNAALATHLDTVANLAEAVARRLGLCESEVALTRLAAELHDVGKAAIPDSILDKPDPLDIDEWEIMKQHTIIGERILAASPSLAAIAPIVRSSHERPDGFGYPDGLLAGDIPVNSSIVSVVDAYDAMTTCRPYNTPLAHDEAIEELRRCAGTQFDGVVVEAFASVCEDVGPWRPRRSVAPATAHGRAPLAMPFPQSVLSPGEGATRTAVLV